MEFIYYPPCSTCKKAKDFLDSRGISYEGRNIKEKNPSYEELKLWYERSGLPLKSFFNTSGMIYRTLKLKDKLPGMSEEEQLELLSSDGMLVKRPLLINENQIFVGFKPKNWEEIQG